MDKKSFKCLGNGKSENGNLQFHDTRANAICWVYIIRWKSPEQLLKGPFVGILFCQLLLPRSKINFLSQLMRCGVIFWRRGKLTITFSVSRERRGWIILPFASFFRVWFNSILLNLNYQLVLLKKRSRWSSYVYLKLLICLFYQLYWQIYNLMKGVHN